MRKIKFRVWKKYDNCFEKMDDSWTFINGAIAHKFWNNASLEKYYELQQYTGLKDKNGVEIYENDLIKIGLDWRGYGLVEIIAKVYFKDGCFRAKALNSDEDVLLMELHCLEVVGNIHESLELIQKLKDGR